MQKHKVGELCRPCPTPLTAKADDGIETAIRRFASESDTHVIFVVDDRGRLEGSVGIRHILNWVRLKLGISKEHHAFTRGVESYEAFEVIRLAESAKIGDIASPAASVKRTDSLAHSLNVMADEGIAELAVVDDDNKLVGEVKLTQVLAKMLDIGTAAGDK